MVQPRVTLSLKPQNLKRLSNKNLRLLNSNKSVILLLDTLNHALIFYNVFEISRILNELRQEGYLVEVEAVVALSPCWTQHVNRFGLYDLNLNRCLPPIDYDAPVVQNIDP